MSRIDHYLRAIETGTTEQYHDEQDLENHKITLKEYNTRRSLGDHSPIFLYSCIGVRM